MPKLTPEQEKSFHEMVEAILKGGEVPLYNEERVKAASDDYAAWEAEDGRQGVQVDIFANNPALTAYLLATLIEREGGKVTFTQDELKAMNGSTMAMVGSPEDEAFEVVVAGEGEPVLAIDGTPMVQK